MGWGGGGQKGEFKGLGIGRSKTQEEIDPQIDIPAKEFQKIENSDAIQEEERESILRRRGGVRVFFRGVKSWIAPIPKCLKGMKQKERNDPKEERVKGKTHGGVN